MFATGTHLGGAGLVLALTISAVLWAFRLRWERDALADIPLQPGGWPAAITIVAASAVIHELLHAAGFLIFGRAAPASLAWTFTARGLGFALRLTQPISMTSYRVATLLPAAFLALGCVTAGFLVGAGLVLAWGLFFLFECIADIALLLATRSVPPHLRVLDPPSGLGLLFAAS